MEKVMRASRVGFPCDRCLWYSVNGFNEDIGEKSKRIFAVGTALEAVAVDWLKDDGWDVRYNPGSQEAELELTIPLKGGKLAGHPDCFISKPGNEDVLIDIKTMNERSFTQWKRNGTEKDKPQYLDQVHVYAEAAMRAGFPLGRLGIVGVNKNNSAMHIDLFDFEPERMSAIIERTERIFAVTEAPEPGERMEGWCCSYCGYSYLCELAQEKRKDTAVGADAMKTNDPAILNANAMELLKEARELSKAGTELETEAKAVLDEQVRQKGIRSVAGGGLILTLTESASSRFDTKSFRKEYPDMAAKFTKTSNSVIYNLKEAV